MCQWFVIDWSLVWKVLEFNCCDECVGMQLLWVRKLRQAAPGVTAATVVVFYQTGIVLASA